MIIDVFTKGENQQLARTLYQNNNHQNYYDSDGKSLLYFAVTHSWYDVVTLILKQHKTLEFSLEGNIACHYGREKQIVTQGPMRDCLVCVLKHDIKDINMLKVCDKDVLTWVAKFMPEYAFSLLKKGCVPKTNYQNCNDNPFKQLAIRVNLKTYVRSDKNYHTSLPKFILSSPIIPKDTKKSNYLSQHSSDEVRMAYDARLRAFEEAKLLLLVFSRDDNQLVKLPLELQYLVLTEIFKQHGVYNPITKQYPNIEESSDSDNSNNSNETNHRSSLQT